MVPGDGRARGTGLEMGRARSAGIGQIAKRAILGFTLVVACVGLLSPVPACCAEGATIRVSRPSPADQPLLIEIRAEQGPSSARQALAHFPVLIHAFDLDNNALTLRPVFEMNGARHALQRPPQPVRGGDAAPTGALHGRTGEDGCLRLQLYLDLERIARLEGKAGPLHLPSARRPLSLRVMVEAGSAVAQAARVSARETLVIDRVGRISAMSWKPPAFKRYRGHQNWEWREPAPSSADASIEARIERIPAPAQPAGAPTRVGDPVEDGMRLILRTSDLAQPPARGEGWVQVDPGWLGLDVEFLDGHRASVRAEGAALSWVDVGRGRSPDRGSWVHLQPVGGARLVAAQVSRPDREGRGPVVLLWICGAVALVAILRVAGRAGRRRRLEAAKKAGLVSLTEWASRARTGNSDARLHRHEDRLGEPLRSGISRTAQAPAVGMTATVLAFRRRASDRASRRSMVGIRTLAYCSYCFSPMDRGAESCSWCGVSRASHQGRGSGGA